MKKLRILLPIIMVFAAPWTHRLVYENIMLAWPGADECGVHIFGIFATAVACIVTALMAVGEL